MKSVEEVINDLQSRVLAYEVMFQSIFYALPDDIKEKVVSTIEDNFKAFDSGTQSDSGKAKLAAAKVIASRTSGAKL
ncbi:hypothetical protein [Enterobacter ludwigii]|jgi:hypothetical protein|uniref:hypothetical protein n=1 Tax=Enterobacter ludwigii TaxID=299767 RepID=UPI002FCFFBA5